jgi:hypothetical protein
MGASKLEEDWLDIQDDGRHDHKSSLILARPYNHLKL